MKLIILLSLIFVGCASDPMKSDQTFQIGSTLWMQNAAEVKALDYQAFNIAKAKLDLAIQKRRKSDRPLAIVFDIDETVLDNSPFQAYAIMNSIKYSPEKWGEWISMRSANALPGVANLIKYAHQKGVEVFLISNRKIKFLDATYDNLKNKGVNVKKENIFLRTTSGSKLSRRKEILKKHDIVLLVGDNLADFHVEFEQVSRKERDMLVEKNRKLFGDKYIILPNPMYGDWLRAIYYNDENKTEGEKRRIRKEHLYPFK